MSAFVIKQFDSEPPLEGRILDARNRPIPINPGDTVLFRMRSKVPGLAELVQGQAEVIEGPRGMQAGDWTLRYSWQEGDTVTAGLYDAEIVIQFEGGGQRTIPSDDFFTVEVEMNVIGDPNPSPVTDTVTVTRH